MKPKPKFKIWEKVIDGVDGKVTIIDDPEWVEWNYQNQAMPGQWLYHVEVCETGVTYDMVEETSLTKIKED